MTYLPTTSKAVGTLGDLLAYGMILWAAQNEDIEHLWNMGEECVDCHDYFWDLVLAETSFVHPRKGLGLYLRFHHDQPEHHFIPYRKAVYK
jgi:hypothetical protein